MKPLILTLRNISANYIDDSLLIGDTYKECNRNVAARCALTGELGFVTNQSKSHFTPAQESEFLGFTINTVDMTVPLRHVMTLLGGQTRQFIGCRKL